MRLFTGKNRGAISVFLCLILLPVLVFCGIIVDASRLFASKTVISAAGDLTMNAALSAYDKELKDKYGLLAMAEKPESPKIKETLFQYFRESCNGALYLEKKTGEEDKLHSMIQLEADDKEFEAKGVENSSLGQYDVLKQQIIEYMKFRGPVYIIDDIVEKFKNLPLDNMKEKQEYVEKKSEYGQKISKLGKPLEKAKKEIDSYVEAWNEINGLLQGGVPGFVEEYKSKIAFWLAGKSAEMYLNGEYVDFPWGEDVLRIPEDSATIAANIGSDIIWTEETFNQSKYIDIMAAISVYRQSNVLAGGMTEENGFPKEIIEKFFRLYSDCYSSKETMLQIYGMAVNSYLDSCYKLQNGMDKNIKKMINAAGKAQQALDEAKKKYEEAEAVKKEYESLGEKLEIDNEEVEEENVVINIQELENLKLCLLGNQTSVEALGNVLEQKISSYQTVPGKISEGGLDSVQAGYLLRYTESSAVDLILSENGIYWESLTENTSLCNPTEQVFYKETLAKIGQKAEASDEENKRDEAKDAAKENQEAYKSALKAIKELASAKNLSSEQVEKETGFAYPEDYPGAGKSAINTNEIKDNTVDVKGENANDNTIVEGSGNSMGIIEQLLNSIDELTGSTLEKAYIVEYATEMFNCYTTGLGEEKGDVQSLSGESLLEHYIQVGEIEYILYGNPKTANNVMYAVSQTFAIRLAINSVYIFLDKEENAVANGIASAISSSTGSPWLYPIIKYGYLFCRALADSGKEMAQLLLGEAVPVVPDTENIKLTYKEYLKLYVLCAVLSDSGEKDIVMRVADCIQLNTKSKLSEKYTMVSLNASVKSSTTFLPKVPAFLGEKEKETDGKKRILYRSVLAY